jgi:hypothetical protein
MTKSQLDAMAETFVGRTFVISGASLNVLRVVHRSDGYPWLVFVEEREGKREMKEHPLYFFRSLYNEGYMVSLPNDPPHERR